MSKKAEIQNRMTTSDNEWLNPSADLTLSRDEIHVWRADLDPPTSHLQLLAKTLSADERNRAERFYFEQHRNRFIAGRGILRTILARYLGIDPSEVQFGYEPRGKPILAETSGDSRLCFNLSHSQGLALYAVGRDRSLGIDLEYIRPISDAEQLAKRFFSAQEYAVIRALPPSQKQETFFRYWTCKEAYLKATGDGLAQLDQIEILLTPEKPASELRLPSSLASQDWVLQELTPTANYVAALVVAGQGWHLRSWQFL